MINEKTEREGKEVSHDLIKIERWINEEMNGWIHLNRVHQNVSGNHSEYYSRILCYAHFVI